MSKNKNENKNIIVENPLPEIEKKVEMKIDPIKGSIKKIKAKFKRKKK